MRALTAKGAVDRLASGGDPGRVARAAIREVNGFDPSDPPPMNIVVLAADGRYASATNRAGRKFAVMTAEMAAARLAARAVVR